MPSPLLSLIKKLKPSFQALFIFLKIMNCLLLNKGKELILNGHPLHACASPPFKKTRILYEINQSSLSSAFQNLKILPFVEVLRNEETSDSAVQDLAHVAYRRLDAFISYH